MRISLQSVFAVLLFATSCLVQANAQNGLQYSVGLEATLQKARAEQKRIILYTGTSNGLRGSTPRQFFQNNVMERSKTLQKVLPDWLVCEEFILKPPLDPDVQANLVPLLDKYDVRFLTPTLTLLDTDGKKIAGPFTGGSLTSLALHLEPPKVKTPEEVAKGKKLAFFAGKDFEEGEKPAEPLVAIAPFLTNVRYSYLGKEHRFKVKKIALDPWDDGEGGFHVVIVQASGHFDPPLPEGHHPVILLGGTFYRAQWEHFDPADPTFRGIGKLELDRGDDWIAVTVDKEQQRDALIKAFESLKAPRP
jgi:hypothetical protein